MHKGRILMREQQSRCGWADDQRVTSCRGTARRPCLAYKQTSPTKQIDNVTWNTPQMHMIHAMALNSALHQRATATATASLPPFFPKEKRGYSHSVAV